MLRDCEGGTATTDEPLCFGAQTPTVSELLAEWPLHQPMLALGSGAGGGPHGRWSVLAEPTHEMSARGPDILTALALIDEERTTRAGQGAPTLPRDLPFAGGWIGYIGFECGEHLEPAVTRGTSHPARATGGSTDSAHLPDLWLARCDAALVHDAQEDAWFSVGSAGAAQALAKKALAVWQGRTPRPESASANAASVTALCGDADYARDVERTIDLIHAGDMFQANIARRFVADVGVDVSAHRAIGIRALELARYGACLEVDSPAGRTTIASVSPELFLRVDRSGTITTRPIKGTQASDSQRTTGAFEHDAKERAELHMIVDLMRNDLARVCEPRSVRVTSPRHLEHHPTIIHGVAEVAGTLRQGTSLTELLRATFPPGSVTGAPKVRAIQVIRELEPAPRGPYCGAIGTISDCGAINLSVAIRTATISPTGSLTYWSGCGIVAESSPEREVAESHAKAAILRELLRGDPAVKWSRDA